MSVMRSRMYNKPAVIKAHYTPASIQQTSGTVTAWNDTKNSFHFDSATGSPVYVANVQNNHAGVQFNGTNWIKRADMLGLNYPDARSYVFVFRYDSAYTNSSRMAIFMHQSASATSSGYFGFECNTHHTVGNRMGVYLGGSTRDLDIAPPTSLAVLSYSFKTIKSGEDFVVNTLLLHNSTVIGSSVAVDGTFGPDIDLPTNSVIGGFEHYDLRMRGEMCEIIVMDGFMGEAQGKKLHNELKTKYNIA